MNWLRSIWSFFRSAADILAATIVGTLDRWISARVVRLTEQPDGRFQLDGADAADGAIRLTDRQQLTSRLGHQMRGSRVELRLRSSHFLFRTLELPAQAAEFLEGIVTAQIDRLTPWSASDAAFGCSAPRTIDSGRIATVIAVAPRSVAQDFAQSVLSFQPSSVVISTEDREVQSGRINVFDQKAQGFLSTARVRRALLASLVISVVSAASAVTAALLTADRIDTRKLEVLQDVARIQASMRSGAATPEQAAQRALEQRKAENPSVTLVLEALSSIIPDNTYATELHVIDNRLQMAGISQDAPSLIRLLEQSPNFTRATFYAPTTRSSSDPGERFHVEARIEPHNRLGR